MARRDPVLAPLTLSGNNCPFNEWLPEQNLWLSKSLP
jgi:hypothetical protein